MAERDSKAREAAAAESRARQLDARASAADIKLAELEARVKEQDARINDQHSRNKEASSAKYAFSIMKHVKGFLFLLLLCKCAYVAHF